MNIHPSEPFADGVCFDDLHGESFKLINFLATREVVFCTEFTDRDKTYGGTIIAGDWDKAADYADKRGLGEEIVGQLVEVTQYDNGDVERAYRDMKGSIRKVKVWGQRQ